MENRNVSTEQTEEVLDTPSRLNTITPVSKYLAMGLFVALPFLGGWVGYLNAPEKIVEVEKIIEAKVVAATDIQLNEQELPQEDFESELRTKLQRAEAVITIGEPNIDFWNQAWQETDTTFNGGSTRTATFDWLSNEYRKVRLSGDYASYYLFNVSELKVIRSLDDEMPHRFKTVTDWYWTLNDRRGIEVAISDKRVTLYDYVNQQQLVLYDELNTDVSLLESCELGCDGLLDIRSNNDIVFGRYKPNNNNRTLPGELIEAKVLELPKGWN